MMFAIMSLSDYRLIESNQENPLYFLTYDEAEMFIRAYQLTNVAVVPYEKEE